MMGHDACGRSKTTTESIAEASRCSTPESLLGAFGEPDLDQPADRDEGEDADEVHRVGEGVPALAHGTGR